MTEDDTYYRLMGNKVTGILRKGSFIATGQCIYSFSYKPQNSETTIMVNFAETDVPQYLRSQFSNQYEVSATCIVHPAFNKLLD